MAAIGRCRFESQKNLSDDYSSLILLSSFQAAIGNSRDAESTLNIASPLIAEVGERAREALSDAYQALGEAALANGERIAAPNDNFSKAQRLFEQSLAAHESQQTRYLAGIAAQRNRDFKIAVDFYSAVLQTSDEGVNRWTEAAWLNLIECLLLQGRFDETIEQSEKALRYLTGPAYKDSHLVALYIRFIAIVMKPASLQNIGSERVLDDIEKFKMEASASVGKLDWDSTDINNFIKDPGQFLGASQSVSPEQLALANKARQILLEGG
jgi:tetratricopeptide (TPR) repeat protein